MTQAATHFAIYFAPSPENSLWPFGSSVLGYDAATGGDVEHWAPGDVDAVTWRQLTEEPRRSGFHATLKAPFRLAAGVTEADLVHGADKLATSLTPFEVVLAVASIDGFIALTPPSSPAADESVSA